VSSLLYVPDEDDPFMIKLQKLKKLARENCGWRSQTPRDSSESADSETSSASFESRSSFSSSVRLSLPHDLHNPQLTCQQTSEATVYDNFTTEDEAKASKSSEATATFGWQATPQAKRDESIPAFCQPIPTTQWLGRPWRDGCHPSVHRRQ
jgi:hypothetical protein